MVSTSTSLVQVRCQQSLSPRALCLGVRCPYLKDHRILACCHRCLPVRWTRFLHKCPSTHKGTCLKDPATKPTGKLLVLAAVKCILFAITVIIIMINCAYISLSSSADSNVNAYNPSVQSQSAMPPSHNTSLPQHVTSIASGVPQQNFQYTMSQMDGRQFYQPQPAQQPLLWNCS